MQRSITNLVKTVREQTGRLPMNACEVDDEISGTVSAEQLQ
jgi:hypothetical protein